MKGNSNSQPNRLERSGNACQVRWNITRNDRATEENQPVESWDFDYANCTGDNYPALVEGIIRSRYTSGQMEAILANYSNGRNVEEWLRLQAWREMAKQVARDEAITPKQRIKATMPLEFVLAGGKYEALADRILKIGSPYELFKPESGSEYVAVYLEEIKPEHAAIIGTDPDVSIAQIDLLDETI
ncbi:MAG: hypothetical protein AB7U05_08905 [Mangrovibacterium sp.]